MTGRTPLDRLHAATIRVQLPVVLAAIPIVTAPWAFAVLHISPEAALLLVASVACATLFAGLLLRGSLRATVEDLQRATDAIARGDFRHRVASTRRDELGALAASIDVMAERLERLEHSRRRTLACVSHELRTPLTIIQGHAFTLARHEADPLRLDRLDVVQGEAARLAELVGDLVDAASLHAGGVRLRVERCDLAELVRDQAARFTEEAAQRDLVIDVRVPARRVPIDADPMRIEQVVANLLVNAVRHATPGTEIAVEVDELMGGGRRVAVTNACAPIPPDVVERVFEPFVQGAARSGSVGLGLAIVEAIAEAHGGTARIDAAAAADGLARFELALPGPQRAPRVPDRTARPVRRTRFAPTLAVES